MPDRPYDVAGLVDGGRVGGPSTDPREQPDVGRLEGILAGLRRWFMPAPGPTIAEPGIGSLGEPQQIADPRTIGGARTLEPLEAEAAAARAIPSGYGTALRGAEAEIPAFARSAGVPLPGRTDAELGAPAGTIGYEPPDDPFRGGIAAGVAPEDPDQALRDLGLATEYRGAYGERAFTNRPTAERARPGQGQFVEGPAGRIAVGNAAALPRGFEFESRRYGGAITPEDLTAAGARGRAAAGAEDRIASAETDLRDLLAQRTELLRYTGGAANVAALDAQIEGARQRLQMGAAEGLPTAERAAKLAEVGRRTTEAIGAPGAREQFDVKTRLEYDKLANDIQKATITGPETAEVTVGGAAEVERIKQQGLRAIKAVEERFKLAGVDKDIASNLAKAVPDLLAFIPQEFRQRAAGSVLMALERAFGRLPGTPEGAAGGAAPGAAPAGATKAPPDIRRQVEQAAKKPGARLPNPGETFRIGGKVYVY